MAEEVVVTRRGNLSADSGVHGSMLGADGAPSAPPMRPDIEHLEQRIRFLEERLAAQQNRDSLTAALTRTQLNLSDLGFVTKYLKSTVEEEDDKHADSKDIVFYEKHMKQLLERLANDIKNRGYEDNARTPVLDLPSMMHCMANHLIEMKPNKKLKDFFSVFDKDGDEHINVYELEAVMRNIGKDDLKTDDMQRILDKIDVSKDGVISFKEFRKVMDENSSLF